MTAFSLDGTTYEYLRGDSAHSPETTHSWEYGHYPKVIAALPLVTGTADVYAEEQRWNSTQIIVGWDDDDLRPHRAWIPSANVRPVIDSEWDIEQYRRCPEKFRAMQWGLRLPGFLLVA
ncbi:hypothetical protein ACOM2C_05065 [Pseudarthrobacter sp. So.54]